MAETTTMRSEDGHPTTGDPQIELPVILAEVYDRPPVIERIERSSGGNSRHTYVVAATAQGRSGDPWRCVVRMDPPDWIRPEVMEREVRGLRIAGELGLPAPRLHGWSLGDGAVGRPYVVTDFVSGESIPRRILRAHRLKRARHRFAADCGAILGRLHAGTDGGTDRDWDALGYAESLLARVRDTNPVFEAALAWLSRNGPPETTTGFVHGDFRLGNMLLDDDGIAAVLDWEVSHYCDPYEDLAWLCLRPWRYRGTRPVAGLGSLEDLAGAYFGESGRQFDIERFRWWQVYCSLTWGLVCAGAVAVERSHDTPAMHLERYVQQRQAWLNTYDILVSLEGRLDE